MTRISVIRVKRILMACQGAYYIASGLWPLVSMSTFEYVTGPKTDDWLVRTVGILAVVIGVTLYVSSRRQAPAPEIELLAVASATAFAASDFVSVATAGISPIYLADGIAEIAVASAWLFLWGKRRRQKG